jgi:hypothetical protein
MYVVYIVLYTTCSGPGLKTVGGGITRSQDCAERRLNVAIHSVLILAQDENDSISGDADRHANTPLT